MKKNRSIRLAAMFLALLPAVFSACVKDSCERTKVYTFYEPVYRTKAEVRANIKSNAATALKNTGKFYVYGNYIFLNEVNKGIHVIDNSNPSQPKNLAFIDVPGNVDLAVKGNILYADLYTDLVVLDIANPTDVKVKKIMESVFPERQYSGGFIPSNDLVIVDWVRHDTVVTESCDDQIRTFPVWGGGGIWFEAGGALASAASAPVGISGSMARFTIVNDYLYTVDRHTLNSVSISTPDDPVVAGSIYAGWDIETIYPFKDKLFLGSMNGLFIFDISNPATPVSQGTFSHARACDPVVADDHYAYITLTSSGSFCGPAEDELLIVDIQNLQNPSLVKAYAMTSPHGLSKDNDILFVCDGKGGLKIFNAANVQNLQLIKVIPNLDTYDVIAYNNRAMVVAGDGLYQYDYTNLNNIRLLSKISVTK